MVDTWLRGAGFDVINHQLLIQKLQEYKFDENALSWFSEYLDGRQQCVQVESSFSSFLSVPWGVPQGSILGPLLFLIFINELPDIVKHFDEETEASIEESSIVVFADDNSPTTVHEDPLVLQNNIQAVGTLVTDWFKKNDISCSSEKTKLLMLGTRANRTSKIEKENIHPNINLCGDTIKETTSEKILGVVVNNTITWKNHLYGDIDNEGLIPGLSKRIGMLKKIRKFVPRFKFSQIVGGMFTSKLMYGMNLWGGVWDIPGTMDNSTRTSINKADMKRLQVLQNKTMRLETNLEYRTPTTELLARTGKLSVHQMVAYTTAVQVYNISRKQEPRYHYDRLFTGIEDFQTRAGAQKHVDFSLSLGRASFFYQGARMWGSLPGNVINAGNVAIFKKMCKTWIKSNIKVKP